MSTPKLFLNNKPSSASPAIFKTPPLFSVFNKEKTPLFCFKFIEEGSTQRIIQIDNLKKIDTNMPKKKILSFWEG